MILLKDRTIRKLTLAFSMLDNFSKENLKFNKVGKNVKDEDGRNLS